MPYNAGIILQHSIDQPLAGRSSYSTINAVLGCRVTFDPLIT